MKALYVTIAAALLFLLFILGPQTCSTVPVGHRAVVINMGRPTGEIASEGVHFKTPFVQNYKVMNVQQLTVTSNTACFSADIQTVTVSYAVQYRVPEKNVIKLYQDYSGEVFESLIQPRLDEALKQTISAYKAEEVVKNREKVKTMTLDKLRLGIKDLLMIEDIMITNIDLTDQIEAAIEQKQVMEQSAQAKEYALQQARTEAAITLVEAQARAEAAKIEGAALTSNPAVIEMEIARRWNGQSPTTVVVGQGGANVLLPLK